MEKHQCKLCLRNFANGRALGGHMRSHMMNLHVPPKVKQQTYQEEEEEEQEKNDHQHSEEMESLPSSSWSSSSSEEEEEEEEEVEDEEIGNRGLMSKGFRKIKQRKRSSVVDPELSFAVEATGSVVLQDGESETESSKKPICRRSKRIRKSRISDTRGFSGYNITEEESHVDKFKSEKDGKSPIESPSVEYEPVSSISDTTPEEDVAYCLMMLSRDSWNEDGDEYEEEEEEESEDKRETKKDVKDHCHDSSGIKVTKSRNRGKYRCETCKKVFRSYQALGGHRASHKRINKVNIKGSAAEESVRETGNAGGSGTVVEEKIHECPVCYRVFPSGQALGGHKRSHVIGIAAANITIPSKPFPRFGETMIDLNLPAPMDDEDFSQVELSAVSDAEFVNPISQ